MKECECEPDHSVVKLGHCWDCPHYSAVQFTQIDYELATCSLSMRHHDDTPHDFNWATYSDERMSTGVCRCGLHQIDYDLVRLP